MSEQTDEGLQDDALTIEKWREERKLLMDMNDDVVAELNRRECALRRIVLLADTMNPVHHAAFGTGPGQPIANGWRVAELMRDVASEVIGDCPTCSSCNDEQQVRLTDDCGNQMWVSCPACRPFEQRPTPEAIEGTEPECPWCHLVPDVIATDDFNTVDCDCGYRYEYKRTTVFVSRPMDFRS